MFFFFNDTATTEIYTLSLHDALPIWVRAAAAVLWVGSANGRGFVPPLAHPAVAPAHVSSSRRQVCPTRSEEHTSELQSQSNLVCRLLLEKKKAQGSAACPLVRLTPSV